MDVDPTTEGPRPNTWFRIWAEVAGAWAIALAHPIYVNIASGPEALTSYGVRRLDLLAVVAVVSLLGPLVITLAELVLRRLFGDRARQVVHGLVIGSLISLVVWQWLLNHGSPTVVRTLLPLGLALLVAWLYVRTELVRNFALMLSFATIVVIGAFCLDYPIKDEVFTHVAKASTPEIDADTPVVVVVFDELPRAALERPDGRIDPRFRNFAMLARKANWYPDAVSVADATTFALPSILTGRDPVGTGGNKPPPPGLADYPDSICRIAEDGGYEIHSYEPVTDLCPRTWDFGTRVTATVRRAVGADDPAYPDLLTPGSLEKKAAKAIGSPFDLPYTEVDEGRREAFDEFIDGLPSERRSLSVLHITLPHVHWMYLPDGRSYPTLRPHGDNQLVSPDSQAEVDRDAQQMMLQLEFTDRELGRLIEKMKADGTWDESLFVVTADHGASFQKGGSRRMVNIFNEGWIMPVPLFVKFPGQGHGKVVPGTVDGRSIVPTVMAQLGLDPLDGMNGRDLTGVDRLPRKKSSSMVATIGGATEMDQDGVRGQRVDASEYMRRLLGRSFYALAGGESLIGKKPTGLTEIPSRAVDPSLYENVDTGSDELPAYFQADLAPPGDRNPGSLAISLNGRIVATARAWHSWGAWHTGVILPAEGFRDGRNEVRVYEIERGR